MKSMSKIAIVALAVAALAAATSAKASVIEPIYLPLGNGAVFSGDLTFSTSSLTHLNSVSGTLTDYQVGTKGYVGSGSDSITHVSALVNGLNLGGGNREFQVYDSGSLLTRNTITLVLNVSDPANPTIDRTLQIGPLTIYLTGANIVLNDIVGGTQYDALPNGHGLTPEPGSFVLLGSGLLGLAGFVRRKIGARA